LTSETLDVIKKKMDFIGGDYLDSIAIPTEGIALTIASVGSAEVPDMNNRSVLKKFYTLKFVELNQQMLLTSKTHKKQLFNILGDKAKDWAGKQIVVFKDVSKTYGKERHHAMRFRKA